MNLVKGIQKVLTTEQKMKLKKLIKEYNVAYYNHEIKGGQPPEEWAELESKFIHKLVALNNYIEFL